MNILILVLAALFLPGLLYYEKRENSLGVLPLKTTLSLLYILSALIQRHPLPGYYRYILAGFVLCLAGDIFLALPRKKLFTFGLISFLLGHGCYLWGFFQSSGTNPWTWIGGALTVIISAAIAVWLRPHLGSMKIPVFVYILFISLMVIGAFSLMGNDQLRLAGRITAFAGAWFFYISDIFVARNQFVKKDFLNRLLGLPLYYTAQFLLAFSVGLVG